MRMAVGTLPFLFLAASACSSSGDPLASVIAHSPAAVTVLVTNGTCADAHCDSLRVLAFPSNQPRTPAGFWSLDLGVLAGRQGCFTLPPSATFRVIGVNPDSSRDTTTFDWTPARAVSLGSQAPSDSRFWASPSTIEFQPDHATGWRITLPGDSSVVAAAPCAP